LKRLITYLWSPNDLWLTFVEQGRNILEGFCDSDWDGKKHRHNTFCVVEYGSRVYRAYARGQRINLLQSFISEIQEKFSRLLIINCNNQGAIALSKENKLHAHTKNIDI